MLIKNSPMVDSIKGRAEINLHDPSLLPILQCTLQCIPHAQKCISDAQTFPISKQAGWLHATAFHKSFETNRHQMLKHLRHYWSYGNRDRCMLSYSLQQMRSMDLMELEWHWPVSTKPGTTQTKKPLKQYIKTGSQNISSSRKKNETNPTGQCHYKGPSLTRDSWSLSTWKQTW